MASISAKYIIRLIIVISLICTIIPVFGQGEGFGDDREFSKRKKFTEQTRIKEDRITKGDSFDKNGPPDPGDGDDGWPIPVGDGMGVLLIGGIIYAVAKRKKLMKMPGT